MGRKSTSRTRATGSLGESIEQQSSTQSKSSKRVEYCENNSGELLKRRARKQRSQPDKIYCACCLLFRFRRSGDKGGASVAASAPPADLVSKKNFFISSRLFFVSSNLGIVERKGVAELRRPTRALTVADLL